MNERTEGQIAIYRDHPDAETAAGLIYIRPVGTALMEREIASVYGATAGSEQEANAEFIVRAWSSHDLLVAALREARERMIGSSPAIKVLIAQTDAALAAAGVP